MKPILGIVLLNTSLLKNYSSSAEEEEEEEEEIKLRKR